MWNIRCLKGPCQLLSQVNSVLKTLLSAFNLIYPGSTYHIFFWSFLLEWHGNLKRLAQPFQVSIHVHPCHPLPKTNLQHIFRIQLMRRHILASSQKSKHHDTAPSASTNIFYMLPYTMYYFRSLLIAGHGDHVSLHWVLQSQCQRQYSTGSPEVLIIFLYYSLFTDIAKEQIQACQS